MAANWNDKFYQKELQSIYKKQQANREKRTNENKKENLNVKEILVKSKNKTKDLLIQTVKKFLKILLICFVLVFVLAFLAYLLRPILIKFI